MRKYYHDIYSSVCCLVDWVAFSSLSLSLSLYRCCSTSWIPPHEKRFHPPAPDATAAYSCLLQTLTPTTGGPTPGTRAGLSTPGRLKAPSVPATDTCCTRWPRRGKKHSFACAFFFLLCFACTRSRARARVRVCVVSYS